MKERFKLLIHGKCLLYNRIISPMCILWCSLHELLWVKFNTLPRGYKTFFMLNSTEHGNSTAHKTNTLTKKTFLSFQLADVVIQHLRVGKIEKFFYYNICELERKKSFFRQYLSC